MSVARNTVYNLLGGLFPMLVALITVPLYLKLIGAAEYGILTIAWLLMGYSTYAELGVGQGIAHKIAQLDDAKVAERNTVFWTGFLTALIFGLVAGCVAIALGHMLIPHWVNLGTKLKYELLHALPLLAVAGPLVTGNSVLASAIESRHHFKQVNIVQSAGLGLAQGLPLVSAFLGHQTLFWLLGFAVLGRAIMFLALFLVLIGILPLRGSINFARRELRFLLGFGGWVTLSNVAETLLGSLDRWFAGAFLGAEAVAYYAVPANLATRISIFPVAFVRTLFPRFSAMNAADALRETLHATAYLGRALAPLIGAGIVLIGPFLRLWVGPVFAEHAMLVAPILLLAAWVRSITEMADVLLRATRRPHVVALIRLLEIPLLFAMSWFGFKWLGLIGLAWAWCLRLVFDAAWLWVRAGYAGEVVKYLLPPAIGLVVIYLIMYIGRQSFPLAAFAVSSCLVGLLIVWTLWMDRNFWGRIWSITLHKNRKAIHS